ncbi:MAG: TIGR02757 family protein [Bacteroidia bacterium]|nr:TIGR02757 family protein [Bacteroidia bacterium]
MNGKKIRELKLELDALVGRFNRLEFIEKDPISIPHRFKNRLDIEISGLFAALFSWGQRKTIIQKCLDLLERMDNAPHAFLVSSSEPEWSRLEGFVHRTFNDTDLLYICWFLRDWYSKHASLEEAFLVRGAPENSVVEYGFIQFHKLVFSMEPVSERSKKHVANPETGSACKRLNMFLRWMVRKDDSGVDFGIWKNIPMDELICPLDVHSGRVARKFGLLERPQNDWKAALELSNNLKLLDTADPVKYDFALFGAGVEGIM